MTADPNHIDPTAYLEELLTQASPDLMRQMLSEVLQNEAREVEVHQVLGCDDAGGWRGGFPSVACVIYTLYSQEIASHTGLYLLSLSKPFSATLSPRNQGVPANHVHVAT